MESSKRKFLKTRLTKKARGDGSSQFQHSKFNQEGFAISNCEELGINFGKIFSVIPISCASKILRGKC